MDKDPKPRGMIEGALWQMRHPQPMPVRVTLTRLFILVPLLLLFAAIAGFMLAHALATGVAWGRHHAVLRAEGPVSFAFRCFSYVAAILFCLFVSVWAVVRYRKQGQG